MSVVATVAHLSSALVKNLGTICISVHSKILGLVPLYHVIYFVVARCFPAVLSCHERHNRRVHTGPVSQSVGVLCMLMILTGSKVNGTQW